MESCVRRVLSVVLKLSVCVDMNMLAIIGGGLKKHDESLHLSFLSVNLFQYIAWIRLPVTSHSYFVQFTAIFISLLWLCVACFYM